MHNKRFNGNFTQQEALPAQAIAKATEIMQSGRLHRYNVAEGETSETALLEQEYAQYMGSRYCLACTSGGYALHIALRACGLQTGQTVLTNAFTLSPVPGAIHNAGGVPIFVESTDNLVIDLADLEQKLISTQAKFVLISHMRGHLVDMDALSALCKTHSACLVEDCAHTMGAKWKGRLSGSYGDAACFSTQTYKHINSGEGGLLISNNPDLIAQAILLSGSYMLYDKHLAAPEAAHFDELRYQTPNMSGRMDNLRAAILRPQLTQLDNSIKRWNERYAQLESVLATCPHISLPTRPEAEYFVGSSLQFLAPNLSTEQTQALLSACRKDGVELKWFGAPEPAGYTSVHHSWKYTEKQSLPNTDAIMKQLFDLRLPLTFSVDDCRLIGHIIVDSLNALLHSDCVQA